MEQLTFELLMEYIDPRLLILIPILWGLGNWFKAIPRITDWTIPFYLMLVSVVLAVSFMTIFHDTSPASYWIGFVQGLAISVVQGYAFNIYKQVKKGDDYGV